MSNLKRIWTAMLTRDGRWDGSRNQTVLIVNQRGQDRLHHTFPKGFPAHQERGQANLYEVDVTANEINAESLNTSSIRVGLRGRDYWRPQHLMVWGERADNHTILPLAAERDLAVTVSNDPKEGPISFPLRPIGAGADDMMITHLILMLKTAEVKDAGSKSSIHLRIANGKEVLVDYKIPDTPQADHQIGQANFYLIPVENRFSKAMLKAKSIRLSNQGFDSWLPKSFFLFGLNQKARRSESLVTLVHLSEWSLGWLSSDKIDHARKSVVLPLFNQDHPLKGNGKPKPAAKIKAEKKEVHNQKGQQVKAEKKEVRHQKQEQVKAEKKEVRNQKGQQVKAEKKEARHQKQQQVKVEKKEAKNQKGQQVKTEKKEVRHQKGQQVKAEKKEARHQKQQQVKAEKKEAKNQKRQGKTEVLSQQQSSHMHSQTINSQKEGEWIWVETTTTTKEVKNKKGKSHKTGAVAKNAQKHEIRVSTHHDRGKAHAKNGSQHVQNGHNQSPCVLKEAKSRRCKVSKSNGHQQTQTEEVLIWLEGSSISQQNVTTFKKRELVAA